MEHKKNLLSIYADDVHLVKEFCALKPNSVQVRIESNHHCPFHQQSWIYSIVFQIS